MNWIPSLRREACPLLTGDAEAEAVLRQLSEHADCHVRRLASVGLNAIPGREPAVNLPLFVACCQ